MAERRVPRIVPALVAGLLLALGTGTAFLLPLQARAQQPTEAPRERATRKTPAMRETVFRELSAAQAAADEGRVDEAIRMLNKVEARKDLNSYELAQLYNFYGFIYYAQDEYRKSIQAYEMLLAQPDLPEALEATTLYGIAQLSLVTEDYDAAVDYLERWFRLVPDPGPQAYVLLAQAHYQQARHEEALKALEKAMDLARSQGQEIKENWLLMARALYFELGRYDRVVEVLETLLEKYPRNEYWPQLAAMYGEAGREKEQLVAYEIAYQQGVLDQGRQQVLLAQLYLQQDVPYKAAKVLERGMADGVIERDARNLRLLSQAWTLAQDSEKAIVALHEAARVSGDPELHLRLAQQYAGLARWDQALDAAQQALAGDVNAAGEAHMLAGMAQYNLGRLDAARESFRAAASDGDTARTARQWLEYLDKEQARKSQLAGVL